MNLLLVGNDSRVNLTDQQLDRPERRGGLRRQHRHDDPRPPSRERGKASFVSFPRDSYVSIPGHGQDKLNAAYAYGMQDAPDGATDAQRQSAGAQLLVQTISQLSGLRIDHYAEVDLLGLLRAEHASSAASRSTCARPSTTPSTPARSSRPGCRPSAAPTRWSSSASGTACPRGDFDRIVRQQVYIAGVLRNILSQNVLLDLGKQRELADAAGDALTVDNGLNLFDLAAQMQSITAGSIDFQTIPYVGDAEDDQGRYILQLQDTDTLHAFFAQLSADPEAVTPATADAPETVAPGDVSVDVFNGSGTGGLAASTADELTAAGFVVVSTGNADSSSYTLTEIRYAEGDAALANTLAAAIPGASTAQSDDAVPGTLQLVLGSDFTGVGQAVEAPPSTAAVAGEDARTAADTSCIN